MALSGDRLLIFLLENKKRGSLGEKIAQEDYIFNGFKIVRTGIGSDFVAYKKIDGKLYKEYVEVKTGNARQSILQKRKMKELRRMGIRYSIYRITEKFLTNYLVTGGEETYKINDLKQDLAIQKSSVEIEKLYSEESEA